MRREETTFSSIQLRREETTFSLPARGEGWGGGLCLSCRAFSSKMKCMNIVDKNCHICGVELTPANSFTCPNCQRTDLCILHKGPSSGMCSICLDNFRKRMIYPTFAIISFVILFFSPYIFTRIPMAFLIPMVLLLPFWLMIESARPVVISSKLKKIIFNTLSASIFLVAALIIMRHIVEMKKFIILDSGMSASTFLILGIILLLLGFVYTLSTSLGRLGIVFFNYDYPEEYSILLKKAGRDPEMIGTLKWDLRWITWVNFIYGFFFIYLYMAPSG